MILLFLIDSNVILDQKLYWLTMIQKSFTGCLLGCDAM